MTTWNFTISQDLKRKDINIVEDTVSNAYETVLYLNRTRGHEDHESEPDKEVRVFIHLSVKDSYEKVFCFEHKPFRLRRRICSGTLRKCVHILRHAT